MVINQTKNHYQALKWKSGQSNSRCTHWIRQDNREKGVSMSKWVSFCSCLKSIHGWNTEMQILSWKVFRQVIYMSKWENVHVLKSPHGWNTTISVLSLTQSSSIQERGPSKWIPGWNCWAWFRCMGKAPQNM